MPFLTVLIKSGLAVKNQENVLLQQCFPTFFVGGLIPNLPKSLRTQNATMKATSHRVWLVDNVTSLNHNLSEEATKQTQ